MERPDVRKRNRLILEAREELRQLRSNPTAREIDEKVKFKDVALHARWTAAQSRERRRRTILQVLRDEDHPKPRPAPAASSPPSPSTPAILPALVWPLGMTDRKARDPKFKLPFLYRDGGGSGKLFLECLGEKPLHEVEIELGGSRIAFHPSLRPGEFVEVDWARSPEVKKTATWGGWRERILAQPSNKEALDTLRKSSMRESPLRELAEGLTKFAEANVAEVERVMPLDFEKWRSSVYQFPLKVRYGLGDSASAGEVSGTLAFGMDRQWFEFRDSKGRVTPIR